MIITRLNDAAIALHRVLSREQIAFGIFGGYAVATFGGPRESKDVDCIASVSRDQVIQLLNGKDGFQLIPQTRQDYVAFFWSDPTERGNKVVLVEIFCEKFPGSQFALDNVPRSTVAVNGCFFGKGDSCFLDPFYVFKGKLRAAAARDKFHDTADMRVLVDKFPTALKSRAHELNLESVGLSLKRYPELHLLYQRLGVDIEKAEQAAKDLDPENLPVIAPGDVQRGLLE
ncbi:hypothetical protein E4U43_008399 [Claviceps pusilla]|uniref:Uncharacterized protein n=1 Tax=Claviceps pusilla TaxID=123648 RepID=A0A9P7NAZ4_9HYPO|nr:hypothetical protein E4U43_008399 [Claviceps pusilla]